MFFFAQRLPHGQPQIPKSFLLQVCSISKWINRCWDSIGVDYLSAVISMPDFQGLRFQRPNQRYYINFLQWCSIQGNRRMQINQFYMLKPIFLSYVPGDGKWWFFPSCLSILRHEKNRDFVAVMKHRKRELIINCSHFRLKGKFSLALLHWVSSLDWGNYQKKIHKRRWVQCTIHECKKPRSNDQKRKTEILPWHKAQVTPITNIKLLC